jgi:hypothetical protein
MDDWKFSDDPLTGCFTTSFVLDGSPIVRVFHDFDGDWQFHGQEDAALSVAKLVALSEIVRLDKSILQLHDLPCGWGAERNTPNTPWQRFKNNPFPSFEGDGFYLEDAVWIAESWTDIKPPGEDELDALDVGDFVKLLFRFAAEESDREDGQVERMWVELVDFDEQGNFVGTIANDPHHQVAKFGDVVHFHSLHVAEIGDFD